MLLETEAEKRATYYKPEIAFNRPAPAIPARVFRNERTKAFEPACPTGFIALDQREEIGCAWPATTPALLARYLVLKPGQPFDCCLNSSGDAYYVVRGAGWSKCADEVLEWNAGDGLCLPGGTPATHGAAAGAILLVVNDEPLLRFLGAQPGDQARAAIKPTLFRAGAIADGLRAWTSRSGEQKAAGKSVVFVTEAHAARRLLTPTLLASINSLDPGGDQRPHKHSSAALTLSIQGDGVYSMVDGTKVDWEPDTLIVTPPGLTHSHHNRGSRMMTSFVAQDTGLYTELRTTNFMWTDA
jgi:gentisate 1,2-dioxygenase